MKFSKTDFYYYKKKKLHNKYIQTNFTIQKGAKVWGFSFCWFFFGMHGLVSRLTNSKNINENWLTTKLFSIFQVIYYGAR